MFERFTDRARRVVVLAQEEARLLNHNYIGTEHILLGLIHEGEGVAARALESLNISLESVRSQVVEIIGQGAQAPSGHIPFTPRAKKVLELSLREALQLGHNYIGTEHILLGLIREGEGVAAQVLQKLGAELHNVRQTRIQLLSGEQGDEPAEPATPSGPLGEPASGSTVLDQFGRNLTQLARERKLDPVIGRHREIERVMQILSRRTKNNPVLIGEPGVGKTAIVEGLAQRIADGEVPSFLADKRILGERAPGGKVNVPPRGADPQLGVPTSEPVELGHTGTVTSFCVVNVQFYGQVMEIPYVSALILLDGADLPLMHLIQECPTDDVRIGMRLEAVWVDEADRRPNLDSIKYFRPIDEPDVEVRQPGRGVTW